MTRSPERSKAPADERDLALAPIIAEIQAIGTRIPSPPPSRDAASRQRAGTGFGQIAQCAIYSSGWIGLRQTGGCTPNRAAERLPSRYVRRAARASEPRSWRPRSSQGALRQVAARRGPSPAVWKIEQTDLLAALNLSMGSR
jgi:hypothetical protein